MEKKKRNEPKQQPTGNQKRIRTEPNKRINENHPDPSPPSPLLSPPRYERRSQAERESLMPPSSSSTSTGTLLLVLEDPGMTGDFDERETTFGFFLEELERERGREDGGERFVSQENFSRRVERFFLEWGKSAG